MTDALDTERLLLRPIAEVDLDPLAAIWADPEVMRHLRAPTRDRAESRAKVGSLIDHQRRHGFGKWAVVERASASLVGYCGIELSRELGAPELGYCLARSAWGKGYATEAARAWLRRGLEELGLERAVAIVIPENTASIRVLEKLGMRRLGPIFEFGRDWFLYESV